MDVILEQRADNRNMPQPSRATSQSVARALAVLDLLASATGALGVREVRLRGFAVADEENFDNVFSFGAVIRDASGEVVAAISGAVPRHPLLDDEIDRLCGLVSAAAQRISYRLGAAGRPQPARVPELRAF